MRKKMYWGIVTLIILLLGVTAVLLLRDTDTDPEIIYKTDVEPARKTETPIAEKPTARPGFKMVKHGDHWHEVPINAPDTGQDQPHEPNKLVEHPGQTPKTFTGKLTYHKELLETHPVQALRLQTEERGHWSAEWIPTFDPGDQEAEAIAYNLYIRHYYNSIGDTDNPIYKKAAEKLMAQTNAIDDNSSAKRKKDLLRLTWADLPPEESVTRVSSSNHTLPLK